MVIAFGHLPVVPRIVEVPSGVIFDTVPLPKFVVYIFPDPSIIIPIGSHQVVPKIDETHVGVIFVTLLLYVFAV